MLQINIGEYENPEVEAAFRVLVEISVLLSSFGERIMLVGGWIPELFHPQEGHIGSLDADFLIDHQRLQEAEYTTIERLLVGKGYQRHPDPQKYFTYVKTVDISGQSITVDVDFLAGKYWGTGTNRHSQHVQGIKALKASGGDFAMSAGCNSIKMINGRRTDGALVNTEIRIVSLPGFLVMKAYAMKGRDKNKDAYDIYFCIKHHENGIPGLVQEFEPHINNGVVLEMISILDDGFNSPNHSGPKDVADNYDIGEQEFIKRDAFEQVQAFLKEMKKVAQINS